MLDGFGDYLQSIIHIGLGCRSEQAEAETGAGAGLVEAHGHQHMARLGRAGVAGRATADGYALEVESNDERLAFKMIEPDVGGVGDAGDGVGAVLMNDDWVRGFPGPKFRTLMNR